MGNDMSEIPRPSKDLRYDLVLLDRDGTLNRLRPGYVTDPEELDVLPGAADAVQRINALGARVVVVTNQRGLARNLISPLELQSVHLRLISELGVVGAHLDGIQVCGHESGTCDCRKPAPGLVFQAILRAPWARPERVLMVGDADSDAQAASNAGVRFVRIEDPRRGLAEKIEQVLALCAHKD